MGRVGTRFSSNDRGAVLPIVALALTALMVMTAFSVDIGRQMTRRREAQGVADVVALDMARMLDGRTRSALESDPQWDQTRRDAAARNNFPESGVVAELGHWDPYAQTFTASGPMDIPDAVQVSTHDVVDFFFARVIGITQGSVSRSAVATQDVTPPPNCMTPPCPPTPGARALGVLGSVGAGFRYYDDPSVTAQYNVAAELRAQVMNSELYTALGFNGTAGASAPPVGLNLDVLSYQGLSSAFVRLGDLAAAAGFGSVDQLLAANLTAQQLLNAEVTALQASDDAADLAAGNKIGSFAAGASSTLTVRLGDFIKIAQGQGNRAVNARINALDLIAGTASIINGRNFFTTTINTSIPGVPTVPIRVAIIQKPQAKWNSEGLGPCSPPDYLEAGCGPRTAQVRIATSIPVTLDLTPYGVPVVQATTIPVVFEAASADSLFTAIHCAQPLSNSTTDFRVFTNGVAMHIGSVTDAALQSSNTLTVQAQPLLTGSVNLGLVSIDLTAGTSVSESKTFKNGAVYAGDVTSNAGILGGDETHTFTGNTRRNMVPQSWRYAGGLGNTSISTTMFNNLGITDPVLNAAVSSALNSSLANLDQLLMDPLLSSYGITLAGADGSIMRVDCNVHLVK